MLSRTLIQMIEDHSEQITARVIRSIRQDSELREVNLLPESELRDRAVEILKNLGHWLAAGKEGELARRCNWLGRHRFEELIPLHEVVRSVHILRQNMIDFVRDQGVLQSYVELYAEEELEHGLGRFFDNVVYYVVRGYEEALRNARSAA